jgi:hypothetical protein
MWTRVAAGVVPGFFLAAGVLGLVCWSLPGPWQGTIVPGLAAFAPLWIGLVCVSLRFANGVRAWAWLTVLAALSLALLWLLQASGWVR